MLMTMGGKTFEASSGAVMVSPSLTLSCTAPTALPMMTLPEVSLTMVSACRIGTPLLTRVPSVRVKREMATLLMTGPSTGMFSLKRSQTRRPGRVRMVKRKAMTKTTITQKETTKWWAMASLIPSTNRVKPGSFSPGSMSLKMSLNFGTTHTIKMVRMQMATVITALG